MEVALTLAEAENLTKLEVTIGRGLQTFVEVGQALLEIRDGRLYRTQHATFEDYCRERWGMVASRARQLIGAANVVANLSVTNVTPILPANEAQARALAKYSPQFQRTIWPTVVETAPDGAITAAHIERTANGYLLESEPIPPSPTLSPEGEGSEDFTTQDSPKARYTPLLDSSRPRVLYTPQGLDACQTPAYALDPLLPYLSEDWTIWEPACGEGLLIEGLYNAGFRQDQVTGSDMITGQDFFGYEPETWDCLITNPPFSLQFEWLERCYSFGKPFALLLKVDVLGTKTAQQLFSRCGLEVIFMDKRINFKMPFKQYDGRGAWFAVAWYTWGLSIGRQITFVEINNR